MQYAVFKILIFVTYFDYLTHVFNRNFVIRRLFVSYDSCFYDF